MFFRIFAIRLDLNGVHHGVMMHVYTGIGSRDTPPKVLITMRRLAAWLARARWSLRSGSAPGADTAWENGMLDAGGGFESFLPWEGFEKRSGSNYLVGTSEQKAKAEALVAPTHPCWHKLSDGDRSLHIRNAFEVLGLDLCHPSALLLCWTADGCQSDTTRSAKTGGTATAIVLAETYGVPIINMAVRGWEQRLWAYWSLVGPTRQWDFGLPIARQARPDPVPKRAKAEWMPPAPTRLLPARGETARVEQPPRQSQSSIHPDVLTGQLSLVD